MFKRDIFKLIDCEDIKNFELLKLAIINVDKRIEELKNKIDLYFISFKSQIDQYNQIYKNIYNLKNSEIEKLNSSLLSIENQINTLLNEL